MQTAQRKLLRNISAWRYKSKLYNAPYEIKAIQKFIRYRQPELEGF